jgi:hypothetical protein
MASRRSSNTAGAHREVQHIRDRRWLPIASFRTIRGIVEAVTPTRSATGVSTAGHDLFNAGNDARDDDLGSSNFRF